MLNLDQVSLNNLIIHRIGNKSLEDSIRLSEEEVAMSELVMDMLGNTLLTPFYKEDLLYNFYHESDVALSEMHTIAKKFFAEEQDILETSNKLANQLYDLMLNPKFKGGELWVGRFSNIIVGDEAVDALGLFFLDKKKNFVRLFSNEKGYALETEHGFDPTDYLNGCLICNTESENGYLIRMYGKTKGADYKLWTDEFLILKQNEDDYFQTQVAMNMCHEFVMEKVPEEFDVIRPDQADMLNKSFEYFKQNDTFDVKNFSEEVIEQPEVQESFNAFSQKYGRENGVDLKNEIQVNDRAVKKLSRVFKSIIKLDKNFHVYVHGNRDFIGRGYDEEKSMHFYQLYFKDEN
ncbi:MAG: nucleoid-associated protein [Bacteroidales bacterium]|nr:nucleoid-associated protein [Bacteroidales bacterium]